jgi:hypothetical protein
MIHFTKEEKHVLLFLIAVIFFGSVLQLTFKKWPTLKEKINVVEHKPI